MKNFDLLKALYEVHSPSGREKKLRKFVKRIATQHGGTCVQDRAGNLYVTKGEADTYPCICAHLDQVQDAHSKDFTVYKQDDIIFAYSAKSKSQQGLGADDKNGLWIALELLEELDVLKCAFFVGEEVGCEGSSRANMEFFKDVRFCIQPDRKNGGDLITSIGGDICSREFLAEIDYAEYGYKETEGLMTDVKELCVKGVGVSCINFSCGYYNAHTDEECTNWKELCNALDFARHICTKLTDVFPHKYESKWKGWKYWSGGGYGYGRGGWNTDSKYDEVYYSSYDRYDDVETMQSILEEEPHLTFQEVKDFYGDLFITQNNDTLKSIYDVAIESVREEIFKGDSATDEANEET